MHFKYGENPEILASLDGGDMCDWGAVEVARHDTRLIMRSGSGCSCSDISESVWEPLNWDALKSATESTYYFSPADKTEFLAKVQKLMIGEL